MDTSEPSRGDTGKAAPAGPWEPKVVGFLCNWCTAAAADLAGTTRLKYPANLRPIRTMCSGSVDPVYVLMTLLKGADAVLVGGCHPGDCHYVSGNYKARRRIAALHEILAALGLEPDRVRLEWISASEGRKFARVATEVTETARRLGRNPFATEWEI
jgi:F420-non-reducing hydrogenase iron-sulfur subunit